MDVDFTIIIVSASYCLKVYQKRGSIELETLSFVEMLKDLSTIFHIISLHFHSHSNAVLLSPTYQKIDKGRSYTDHALPPIYHQCVCIHAVSTSYKIFR